MLLLGFPKALAIVSSAYADANDCLQRLHKNTKGSMTTGPYLSHPSSVQSSDQGRGQVGWPPCALAADLVWDRLHQECE